ncbi:MULTISPECIES: hypothetical protein [unclassified Marinovum]
MPTPTKFRPAGNVLEKATSVIPSVPLFEIVKVSSELAPVLIVVGEKLCSKVACAAASEAIALPKTTANKTANICFAREKPMSNAPFVIQFRARPGVLEKAASALWPQTDKKPHKGGSDECRTTQPNPNNCSAVTLS